MDSAFLFPKAATPTGHHPALPMGDGLLDYEVELGLVTLDDVAAADGDPRYLGLVLTNDFTDRETLLAQGTSTTSPAVPASPTPRASRASSQRATCPSCRPTGSGTTAASRSRSTRTTSCANAAPRTTRSGTPRRCSTGSFAAGARTWDSDGTPTTLTPVVGTIPSHTIIQAGTPEGASFRPPDTRQIALGVMEYASTFGTNATSVVDSAVGVYVREAKEDRAYLQPGDRIITRAEHLGQIVTDVTAGDPARR